MRRGGQELVAREAEDLGDDVLDALHARAGRRRRDRLASGRRAGSSTSSASVAVDRRVGQRRVGDDADQRGLEAAEVVGDALGDQLQDAVVADVDPVVVGALAQHRQARGGVGRADVDQQPGLEALAQAVLELGHVARRAVGGQHQLAARLVQRVEGVEELLLGLDLALEELHVVDQQDVVAPVAVLEGVDVAGLQRLEELVGEALDRRVADGQPAAVGADVVADAVQQVGLADAGRADDEERVVGLAGQLGDRERRGVGEAVGVADDELLEGELRVQARGLGVVEERGAGSSATAGAVGRPAGVVGVAVPSSSRSSTRATLPSPRMVRAASSRIAA